MAVPILIADRVKETTLDTGTGALGLWGAVAGYRSFGDAFTEGVDTVYYCIEDGTNWEVGWGSLAAGYPRNTLYRNLLASSTGSLINWGSGSKNVFSTIPASGLVGKQMLWVPAGAMLSRITNGPAQNVIEMATNKNMVQTLDFDATTAEYAQFELSMPTRWNLGTITFEPVWSHPSTTTNFGVVFGLQAVAISNDDTLDVAFGTAQTSTDTGGTTNDLYIGPESSAITVSGTPATGDTVKFQIYRDPSAGSDTMAVDARLHGIRLYYTTTGLVD